MSKLVIWHNPNTDTYYYKIVSGYYREYTPGSQNQYNHKIILVIDNIYTNTYKVPLKKRLLRKLISFLEKRL